MAMFRCFSFSTGMKEKSKGKVQYSKNEDFQTLLVKLQHPRIASKIRDLETTSFDVTVPYGIQNNSECNEKVMSHVKAEVEQAYEGEDEKEDSPSIKRELSDFDLQGHEVVAGEGGFDPTDNYSEKSVDIIQSGNVSDPGIRKAEFWASPKLKRSCSNLERRDLHREITHRLPEPYSKSQSFQDLQEPSENLLVNLESSRSVISHCSADRVMLKRHSSSSVLPSGSKKLWWKLFMWSHRNIHRRFFTKSTQLVPPSAALNSQCGYFSDALEPKQGKALRHVESYESVNKSSIGEDTNNQQWSRFYNENSDFWPQNQWLAFSTESTSFDRVDAWVKHLEIQQPLPENDFDDDNGTSIIFSPSPDVGRSMTRNTSQLGLPYANLSKEILKANSVVQSLSLAASIAHISGIGIKAIPAISHLSNLRSVNLSHNFIVHISPGFLPKGLHTLNLSRNKINNFEGLRELTRLRVLDLSYNRASRIGQGLSNCTLIKELYLAGNNISGVEGLHRLLKLTVLDLSFNKITTTKALGRIVANYNSLQALNLLGNPIQSNIGDDQLCKAICGLLPKLVYLNKQLLKPQRAREVLTDSVAKAALGNNDMNSKRRLQKKVVGQGGSSSNREHRSSVNVEHKRKSGQGTRH